MEREEEGGGRVYGEEGGVGGACDVSGASGAIASIPFTLVGRRNSTLGPTAHRARAPPRLGRESRRWIKDTCA